jgi:23S rRNA (cytidine1920-2'-O)/16S rRNA (cytidine1409-2'-O)-methyltransferase
LRLDLYLVQNQLASSRTQAQDFIENGHVYAMTDATKKIKLQKASFKVEAHLQNKIYVERNELQQFVSRAGLKLNAALEQLHVDVKNKVVLDVGQSTGGFSDCLVQRGAQMLVGVEVGHGQLHESLKINSKIVCLEGLNAKELAQSPDFLKTVPSEKFDMIVMDVSFISITKVMPSLVPYLKKDGLYLFLVKPQFECGAKNLDKNGVVKDSEAYPLIENEIKKCALQYFNNVTAYIESAVLGKDGNREFFIYGQNSN